MDKHLVERFAALFRGNERSYGVWVPDTTKMSTSNTKVQVEQYEAHLIGECGLGIVPIMDDATCWFGVIDIDNHGMQEDIPLWEVTRVIESKNMPLVACRSKSGGIHAYVFCKEPIRARTLRAALEKWAIELGHPKAEIFPKQDFLTTYKDGTRLMGNWINLCYFDGDDTNRYALVGPDRKMNLSEFLTAAEVSKITVADVTAAVDSAHSEAPPCIQHILFNGIVSGARNEALYNITVYKKRQAPNTFMDDCLDINNTVFNPPLSTSEAKTVIRSASRRDYKYKCQQEPLKSLCDSKTCVNREFGITKNEYGEMTAENMLPDFGKLVMYDTDPVKWGLEVGSGENKRTVSNISTEVLYNFEALRMRITETLKIGVPSISKRGWERILIPKVAEADTVPMPDDASVSGMIGNRLFEFLDKTNLNPADIDKEREKILRGIPCVVELKSAGSNIPVRCVGFRAVDFVKYLKSVKSEDLKGPNLWFAMKNITISEKVGKDLVKHTLNLNHTRIKVKGKSITIWYLEVSEYEAYGRVGHSMPDFKEEF